MVFISSVLKAIDRFLTDLYGRSGYALLATFHMYTVYRLPGRTAATVSMISTSCAFYTFVCMTF